MSLFKILKFFITSGFSILIILCFALFGSVIFWIFTRIINFVIGKKYFTYSIKNGVADILLMQKKQFIFEMKQLSSKIKAMRIANNECNNSNNTSKSVTLKVLTKNGKIKHY